MITLIKDRKIINPKSFEDIQELNGYKKKIDPNDVTLKEIIAKYQFTHKVRCGLSNCNQPHYNGFVIVADNGYLTNIGKDCGTKHFGVSFTELKSSYQRAYDEINFRDNINEFLVLIDSKIDEVDKLIEQEGSVLNKNVKTIKSPKSPFPTHFRNTLNDMVKQRKSSFEATFDSEKMFVTVQGLSIMYPENDLRELLVVNLKMKLKELKTQNIDNLSFNELKTYSKWVSSFSRNLNQVKSIISDGMIFFSMSNMNAFLSLFEDEYDLSQMRKAIKAISISN